MARARKKTAAKRALARDKALILLNVFDGTRQRFPNGMNLFVRISDGSQQQLEDDFFKRSSIQFSVPFSDNFNDNYPVLVGCEASIQASKKSVRIHDACRNGKWKQSPSSAEQPGTAMRIDR